MKVEGFELPEDLYYHPDHTWASIEGDLVRVGVSAYGLHLAGEIKAITPRQKGKKIRFGGPIAVLESAKWVGPLKSPVSGTIVECNTELLDDYSPLIKDPYDSGWIVVVKPTSFDEDARNLMTGEDTIREWMDMEIHGKNA
ncbi:MAG: glycine cleavage system protein H [Candidatus Hodarchaeota archaeon]